jgi:pteridine reductase
MATNTRVALVTGGAKRVGRAIVEKLATNGFDVAFTYHRSGAEADAVREAVRGAGRETLAVCANLTAPAEAAAHISSEFRARFDRLDVLVNNASLYEPSALADTSLEQMQRLTAIHVESPLLLVQALAPMLRASRGHVVNMLDLLAERPWPQYLAYCASKAGLWNLTLGLARELAPEVTVNGIAPGVVEWPPGYPEPERERYLRRVPLARAGTPADVADAVHFLVTGGGYVTGQVLRLDGGRSLT